MDAPPSSQPNEPSFSSQACPYPTPP
jgi:hypothetical protein